MTGTHFNYYHICHRKLWLFANGIHMEHTSDLVADGKIIHETTYPQRSEKYEELEIDHIKIDYYDAANKVIHEIKRSNKMEEAHFWQLKYYIFVLEQNGINDVKGVLEYPSIRKVENIILSENDKKIIEEKIEDINRIINNPLCPNLIHATRCKKCSYYDFCYASEINS